MVYHFYFVDSRNFYKLKLFFEIKILFEFYGVKHINITQIISRFVEDSLIKRDNQF